MNDAMNQFELFDKLSDKFFWRLLIDVLAMVVLVRFIYFRIYKKKDYLFTFFLFNPRQLFHFKSWGEVYNKKVGVKSIIKKLG